MSTFPLFPPLWTFFRRSETEVTTLSPPLTTSSAHVLLVSLSKGSPASVPRLIGLRVEPGLSVVETIRGRTWPEIPPLERFVLLSVPNDFPVPLNAIRSRNERESLWFEAKISHREALRLVREFAGQTLVEITLAEESEESPKAF